MVYLATSMEEEEVLSHTPAGRDWGLLGSTYEKFKRHKPFDTHSYFFVLRFDPKVICNDAQRLSVYKYTEFVMAKYRIKQSAEEC